MRSALHKSTPRDILSRNLKVVFEQRSLSARKIADEIKTSLGIHISNRTVQNMRNGTGNVQFDGLMAVARYLRIPLWMLLWDGFDISHVRAESVHELLDTFAGLSELGRRAAVRNIKGQALLEHSEQTGSPSVNGNVT